MKTGTEITMAAETQVAPAMLPADPMVSMIERVVLDPEADIAKLEKMLELRERLDDRSREDEARRAEREFIAAHAAAQTEVPVVVRTRNNKFSGYTYADLADIETQAMPIVRKHGFSVAAWPGAGAAEGFQRVFMRVSHVSGHSHEIHDDFPLDGSGTGGKNNKTAIQAKGSTTSYGRRYLLCGYFGIATADDDGSRRQAPERVDTISAKDASRIHDLIEQTGTDEAQFLGFAKVETVEDIASADVKRLIGLLERKVKEAGNA